MTTTRLLAVLATALIGGAASAQQVPISADETPSAWLVELSSPPAVDGTSAATLNAEKSAFRGAAKQAGIAFTERFSFGTLWNGVSVRADRTQVAALQRLPGVKAVWPVQRYSLPPIRQVLDPQLLTAITMTGADVAQSQLGLTGKGVKVAIVDTGIDYGHPDLGGCFGPGCRVATGWDFVGDAYDSSNADPARQVPHPDADPMDCAGHGTHVTGIVGANGGVVGVAPGVTFGAYRVFGCEGTTDSDVMIAAMERALADGMQVLNMSIGSEFAWPQAPEAVVANRLVDRGVVVVASFGNSGADGLYTGGAPGDGEKVIGVASVDNVRQNLPAFSAGGTLFGYVSGSGSPVVPVSGSYPLARTGTPTTTNDACNALPAGSLAGKVALVRRGTCAFTAKVGNAAAAGAVAVVLYNNASGYITPAVAGVTVPVASITAADGVTLDGRIAAGAVTLTWTSEVVSTVNPTGGLISSFSSYGLSPDLTLKPDVSAPGGVIRSTYPLALGGYANLSGTSMASPHVAGAAALYLQAYPRTNSHDMRDILQNTARPVAWWGNPGLGFLDNVHRQGAGMIRIDDAVQATVRATPGKLSLGESQAGPATRTITLTNSGSAPVTYAVSAQDALATGPNTYTVGFYVAPARVTLSKTSVTVPARGSAAITTTIAAPSDGLPDRSVYGGYVVFTPADEARTIRIPYAGFKGDYQSIQVLTATPYGFPWLARLTGASYVKEGAGASFDLSIGDVPVVLVHLDHQSRMFQMEVRDAVTGQSWHRVFRDEYEVRNATSAGFFAVPWDGTTAIGARNGMKAVTVPAGRYVLVLSVLKALGDENDPAAWETWTSPEFTITR